MRKLNFFYNPDTCHGTCRQGLSSKGGAKRGISSLALAALWMMPSLISSEFLPSAIAQENCTIQANYRDADLRQFIAEIASNTGRQISIDRSVNGRVTVESPPDFTLCRDEVWELFQDTLRLNGYVATPESDSRYRVVPLAQGQRSAGPVGNSQEAGGLITRIFRMNHVDATEVARNIAQLTSEGAVSSAIRSSNALIVVDNTRNMLRIANVIASLDRDNREFRTVPLVNADARDVAQVLSDVARDLSEENGNNINRIQITPVGASNSLLIRAQSTVLNKLMSVIRALDQQGDESSGIAVFPLRYANAEDILPLLQEQFSSATSTSNPAQASNPITGGQGQTVISAYEGTNAIVVNGDAVLRRQVKSVIDQLDQRRAQVLVEAIIVDISDSTAKELGVQYFVSGPNIPFATNVSGQSTNILSAAGAAFTGALTPPATTQSTVTTTAPDGTVTTTENGFDGLLDSDLSSALTAAALGSLLGINGFGLGGASTFGGPDGDSNVFAALLTAIKQDTSSRILSTPSIVVLDNETAELVDGQEIPITTGEQIGDNFTNAFRTVNREQVGVILEVTPQITDGTGVTLEIRQEISSIAGPIIATSTDLITNNSELTTTTYVDDGDILVIGGLISEDQALSEDKVPVLGDVPGLGRLFKTTARSKVKNNLMIFIRPTILRDREMALQATRRKYDYIRGQEMLNDPRAQEDFNRVLNEVTGLPAQSGNSAEDPAN